MDIDIRSLAERMEYLDTVSRWRWSEWGQSRNRSLDYVTYSTRHNAQKDRIPMTYIAFSNEVPVGTVSLWMNDLRCRQDLYPWLASLYVAEKARNKGIGTILQQHAQKEAARLGYKVLYLYTDHENYYEKAGWIYEGTAPKENDELTRLYSKNLEV